MAKTTIRKLSDLNLWSHPGGSQPDDQLRKVQNTDNSKEGMASPRDGLASPSTFNGVVLAPDDTYLGSLQTGARNMGFGNAARSIIPAPDTVSPGPDIDFPET